MPVLLPPACLDYALCAVGAADDGEGYEPLPGPWDAAGVARTLAPALLDARLLAELRHLAWAHGNGTDLSRVDDHRLLALIAAAVAGGRLQLCRRVEAMAEAGIAAEAGIGGGGGKAIAPPPGTESAPPPPSRAPAAPPRPPPPPAPAPPAPPAVEVEIAIDEAAQAAVLREASRDGVPFCAECEKRRLEQEAALA
ncbi:hypothetical protein RA210_U10695 [Rubrivivax sp. A210]|uniref:hypothetical protein n=1 Tax=Rubrivivax sp. A210 TaxID=2772301 RepID=UPI00191B3852|nr:hypothetical protein [Rubrivivax sp. A210]CAD5367188.1 hypothetical protein RA210_U10695 [Rubrivivax sp. A210]